MEVAVEDSLRISAFDTANPQDWSEPPTSISAALCSCPTLSPCQVREKGREIGAGREDLSYVPRHGDCRLGLLSSQLTIPESKEGIMRQRATTYATRDG